MSSTWQQKTPCGVITAIWNHICSNPFGGIEHTRLVKLISKSLNLEEQELAEQHIKTAVEDGLIVVIVRAKQRGKRQSSTHYTFPKWHTMLDQQPDKCCYECHNTGNVEKCEGCMRSFHEGCVKSMDEKHHELSLFVSKEKRIIISASEQRPTTPRAQRRNSTVSVTTMAESIVWPVDLEQDDDDSIEIMDEEIAGVGIKHEAMSLDSSYQSVKVEDDVKEGLLVDYPTFVGIIRPPNRRLERMLNTTTIKPEEPESDSDDQAAQAEENELLMKRYCYACQVLKNSSNNVSPNVGKRELNYLLSFVVEQYKSWLPKNTFAPTKLFRDKVPKSLLTIKAIDICKKVLLRTPTSLADVQEKVANNYYSSLEEFHVDLLDIAHNIGIIHGVNSLDYSAAMYLLADCVYELREIRQCPDCYRHSTEKVQPDWFTRPCRTRHEVVFAKLKSFPYWPAKVVRVTNDRYDVRFFGDKHMRALVNAKCVRPIDTDLRTLRVNTNYRGFQQAMAEMLQYQSLSEGAREHYSFPSVMEQMERARTSREPAMESSVPPVSCGEPVANGSITSRLVTRKRNNQIPQPGGVNLQKQRKLLDRLTNPMELRAKALKLLQEAEEKWSRNLEELKEKHRTEISNLKKKQWCAMCEKEARIQCCWNTSYCTTACQKSHLTQHQKRHQAGNRYHRLRSVSPTKQSS
ncbi:zinc finger MYND domain-containing protein 11 [Anopheles marshallii]|uniref:zinc finger MYND domain-containing protein 11 n=1 Tax=Anopheles marshallii TaxID=1521116 RepID=UPI00237A2074|nr:zinc finger MYND domain-containing protein 11 [Anopheles marshallii]